MTSSLRSQTALLFFRSPLCGGRRSPSEPAPAKGRIGTHARVRQQAEGIGNFPGRAPGITPGRKEKRYCLPFLLAWLCIGFLFFSCARKEEANALYLSALQAFSREQYDKALESSESALRYDSSFYQAAFLKAKILFFRDDLPGAEKILHKLASKYPGYTEARIWLIRCTILREDYHKAAALLEKELSFNTGDWRVLYLYALLGRKTDNYELQLSMNRNAEAVLTDSAKVYMDLALGWQALGMESRAAGYLEKARTVSGSNLQLSMMEESISASIRNKRSLP